MSVPSKAGSASTSTQSTPPTPPSSGRSRRSLRKCATPIKVWSTSLLVGHLMGHAVVDIVYTIGHMYGRSGLRCLGAVWHWGN